MARSFLLCLLGAFVLCVGTVAADEPEPGADTTPPVITNALLSPGQLSFEGGNVQISVEIIDETELSMTTAQAYGSDGSYQQIAIYQGDGNTYYGTLEAAANYSDGTVSYQVEVQAYDAFHNYNAATIGEVQVGPAPQFDETPWVSMASLNPPVLPSSGGPVTISAQAGDNSGLSAVFALITPVSGGASTEVGLNGVSAGSFEGTWEAPPNSGPLDAEYIVEIVVRDDIGQEGRALAGTVTVEAPEVAPPPSPCKGQPHRPASLPQGPNGCGTTGKKGR
jgi:hypothetical protein